MDTNLSTALAVNRRRIVEAVLKRRGYRVDADETPEASLPKGFRETEELLRGQGRVHWRPRRVWVVLRRWLRAIWKENETLGRVRLDR